MKLLQIESSLETFKTISFNPKGLSIILGDDSLSAAEEGSSNGVGKTLSLGIFHHCMGASDSIPKISKKMPKRNFKLTYEIENEKRSITRNALGNEITLNNNKTIKIGTLRTYLNECGAFYIPENSEYISFRTLIKRFSRLTKKDCDHPLFVEKESEYQALINSLHLLGVDISLVISKKALKTKLDNISQELKSFKNSEIIKNLILNGKNPKIQLDKTLHDIKILEEKLINFEIAEDFKIIEKEANNLKKIISNNEHQISILDFNKRNLIKSLEITPDISKQDLFTMYQGLKNIFNEDILKHFDAVEVFHETIARNRQLRLKNELLKIETQIIDLKKINDLNLKNQTEKLQYLQGKNALDEYTAIANSLVELKNNFEIVNNYLNHENNLNKQKIDIQELMIKEDRRALEFIQFDPLHNLDGIFKDIINHLYDNTASGIIIENNTGINQLRYDLKIEIDGNDSDGIDNARVLAFDILNLFHGSNHNINFLWHDNRIFADISPKARAGWFKYILKKFNNSNKQYIATLNNENLQSMKEYLTIEDFKTLENSIVLNLKGDIPENKLLGVQLDNFVDFI